MATTFTTLVIFVLLKNSQGPTGFLVLFPSSTLGRSRRWWDEQVNQAELNAEPSSFVLALRQDCQEERRKKQANCCDETVAPDITQDRVGPLSAARHCYPCKFADPETKTPTHFPDGNCLHNQGTMEGRLILASPPPLPPLPPTFVMCCNRLFRLLVDSCGRTDSASMHSLHRMPAYRSSDHESAKPRFVLVMDAGTWGYMPGPKKQAMQVLSGSVNHPAVRPGGLLHHDPPKSRHRWAFRGHGACKWRRVRVSPWPLCVSGCTWVACADCLSPL